MLSHLVALVLGVMIGALSQYLARRYLDRRREREASRLEKERFELMAFRMPQFFYEMRADVCRDGHDSVREFYVLENRKISVGEATKRCAHGFGWTRPFDSS